MKNILIYRIKGLGPSCHTPCRSPYIRTGWGPARQLKGGMALRTIALLPALAGAFNKPGGGITRSLGGAPSDLKTLTRPDPLPDGQPLRDPDGGGRYPLESITPPHHLFLNSAFNEIDEIREKVGRAQVMIHPETARIRGIAHGDQVRVFNNRGECRFLAHVTDKTQAGLLVAGGLHWPSLSPGGGANQLTSQRITDMGNTCAFHCNRVEVRPFGKKR